MITVRNLQLQAALGDIKARELLRQIGFAWSEPAAAMADAVATYHAIGWSTVPQLPGAKMPLVRWKQFQERRSTLDEWDEWLERWPDAGSP